MRSISLSLSLLALSLLATGCQQQQLSRWSATTKNTVANDLAHTIGGESGLTPGQRDQVMEELDRYVADRQRRDLERENDRLRDELRNRGGGIFPLARVNAGISASAKLASSSSSHARIERRLARTYGISAEAVRKFASILGQTALGNAQGLYALGLDQRALELASRNGGRLSQEQLARAGRALGIPATKLDRLFQHFMAH